MSFHCHICNFDTLHPLALFTCEDKKHLGQFQAYFCVGCRNAITHPLVLNQDACLPVDGDNSTSRLMAVFYKLRVRKVLRLLQGECAGKKVLDVGAGAFGFVHEMAKHNIITTGVEFNSANLGHAKSEKAGVNYINALFDSDLISSGVLEPGTFDVITMWHSLEHLPDPSGALKLSRQLLKPTGLLLISVPNFSSFQSKVGGNYWCYLDIPHHVSHFTELGISRLLSRMHLQTVKRYAFSVEYDVFGWFQTVLNFLSRSHNVLYNQLKKGQRRTSYARFPRWALLINSLSPFLLPLSVLLSLFSFLCGKPSCLELVVKPNSDTRSDEASLV